jgi:hypothetical protein
MYHDNESDAALAFQSLTWFQHWRELVGTGDYGYVETGFLQIEHASMRARVVANIATQDRMGITTSLITVDDVARVDPTLRLSGDELVFPCGNG